MSEQPVEYLQEGLTQQDWDSAIHEAVETERERCIKETCRYCGLHQNVPIREKQTMGNAYTWLWVHHLSSGQYVCPNSNTYERVYRQEREGAECGKSN